MRPDVYVYMPHLLTSPASPASSEDSAPGLGSLSMLIGMEMLGLGWPGPLLPLSEEETGVKNCLMLV